MTTKIWPQETENIALS